jgi:hypothetical protein
MQQGHHQIDRVENISHFWGTCLTIRNLKLMRAVLVTFIWLLLLILPNVVAGQPEIDSIKQSGEASDVIPTVNWIYHIDVGDGYVGIISDSRQQFDLFDKNSKSVFSLAPDSGNIFYFMSMRSNTELVLIGEMIIEGRLIFSGYDYRGNLILGPLAAQNEVEITPCRKFFYSVYDAAYYYNRPKLYDRDGHKIGELELSESQWDIQIMDDSLLLCRDGNRLDILSYPDLSLKKKILINHTKESDFPKSALSMDGWSYAYLAYDKIIVCDLKSGEEFFIPNRFVNDIPSYPNLNISNGGNYLILDWGTEIEVYKKGPDGFEKSIDSLAIPLQDGYFLFRSVMINDRYCAKGYLRYSKGSTEFWSFLFNFSGKEDSASQGIIIDGLVTLDSKDDMSPESFRVTGIKSNQVSTKILTVQEIMK